MYRLFSNISLVLYIAILKLGMLIMLYTDIDKLVKKCKI